MPKQTFVNGILQITEDTNDPKDRLTVLKMLHKGKNTSTLTEQQKVDLFDAYVSAGVITL